MKFKKFVCKGCTNKCTVSVTSNVTDEPKKCLYYDDKVAIWVRQNGTILGDYFEYTSKD